MQLGWLKSLPEKLQAKVIDIAIETKKVGQDDTRRVIHSLKVGLALTLVSLFYYFQTIYDSFGVYAMWAVMTVVVVFEFSVGATIGKCLNRGMATLVAGALGVGAHHLASMSGNIAEPIIIGIFVFVQAAISTFIRFFPKIKARYDYGLLIFILTFALVSVSGFRLDGVLDFAHKRLSTILIGASACVIVSILVCPVWAGEDLQNLVVTNIEKLGSFLEAFGDDYFKTTEDKESKDNEKTFLQDYKTVLNSKNTEETLVNFARWEPGHGPFMYGHPWKQYLKIGSCTRQCAYRIEALNTYLNSNIQVPQEISEKLKESCTKLSLECGKALKELALSIKTMTQPSSAKHHISSSISSSKTLQTVLKSALLEKHDLLQVMPVATVASLLIEVVTCVEDIAESVRELALLSNFKSSDTKLTKEESVPDKCGVVELPVKNNGCSHVAITIDESTSANIAEGNSLTPRAS